MQRAIDGNAVPRSRLPLCFEGELEDPALLHEAEFLCAGEPADAHNQEALRQGCPALELAEGQRFVLGKIPPHLSEEAWKSTKMSASKRVRQGQDACPRLSSKALVWAASQGMPAQCLCALITRHCPQ